MDSGSDDSTTNVDMPHSNVDTTPGNKKGLLLNYDVADRNRKERGGFE